MEKHFKRDAFILKCLFDADCVSRKRLIAGADKNLVKLLCLICKNIISGKVDLKPLEKNNLEKYKKQLRFLSKRGDWQKKKRVFIQKGSGLLPALLSPLISIIISSFLKK